MEKIRVKNFGKIKEAEIELNKMMLFVGDNNSGKSYMASLIYGLYEMLSRYSQLEKINFDVDYLNNLKNKIRKLISVGDVNTKLDISDEIKNIELCINEYLKINKNEILKTIFNHDITAEEIEISLSKEIKYEIQISGKDETYLFLDIYVNNQNTYSRGMIKHVKQDIEIKTKFILRNIVESLSDLKVTYLPVSRTGFMLTYKSLVTDSLAMSFTGRHQEPKTILTRPTADFLSKLSTINVIYNDKPQMGNIISFIEDNVINGKITVSSSMTPDYLYTPNGSKMLLPMSVSSGVVTEMTPLLLFLKYVYFEKMIIEEPEMCLHPKLQWSLTRALIKATHLGNSFILTTHSEAIVQHINDMIKLNKHENKASLMNEFNYQEDDLISENEVNIYQFIVDDEGKTNIENLEYTEDGFVVTSFIDNLQDRLNETIAFED